MKTLIKSYGYPLIASLSAISLISISVSLRPISQWAKMQNECVEKTFRIDGINNAGVATKVWSCNGGGN